MSLETLLTSVIISSFMVLLSRGTWALDISLVLNMGFVLAFFIVTTSGKVVHLIYRYLSVAKYEIENIKYKLE